MCGRIYYIVMSLGRDIIKIYALFLSQVNIKYTGYCIITRKKIQKKKQEINAQKLNHERNTICRLRVLGVQSGVTKLKVVYICVTVSIYE